LHGSGTLNFSGQFFYTFIASILFLMAKSGDGGQHACRPAFLMLRFSEFTAPLSDWPWRTVADGGCAMPSWAETLFAAPVTTVIDRHCSDWMLLQRPRLDKTAAF
jgi:hypothetical protein